MVDAVDKVDVGVARGAENDLRSRREAGVAVGGLVVSAEVGLAFDDAAGEGLAAAAMDDDFAQQLAGNLFGWPIIERSEKRPMHHRFRFYSVPEFSVEVKERLTKRQRKTVGSGPTSTSLESMIGGGRC